MNNTTISTAVQLLRQAAEELQQSHTTSSDRNDWTGEEDAKASYDEHMAVAAELEAMPGQCLRQIAEPAQDARTAFEAISRFMKCEWSLDWDPAGFYDDAKTDAAFTWFEQGYMRAQQAAAPLAAVHPDDAAVYALAALMKAKLAEKRTKGYGGWNDKTLCPQQRLSDMLRAHVDKGDPVDVANFCAMLSARGEGIAPAPQAVPDEFGTAAHWKEKAQYWADVAHRLRSEALRGEHVDSIVQPAPQAALAAVPEYSPNNPAPLRREGESIRDYRVRCGWDHHAHPAEGVQPAVPEGEVVDWEPLAENHRERDMFDHILALYDGDPRAAISAYLRIWAETRGNDSFGLMCAVLANEVAKMHITPATQPAAQGMDAHQYRLIERGELIDAGDQFLRDDFTWQIDPRGIFVGMPHGAVIRPARRAIAAQAKQGGADHD